MEDEPQQEALFYIEGPDERGCVWMQAPARVIRGHRTWGQLIRSVRCCRGGSARSIMRRTPNQPHWTAGAVAER